MKMTKMFLTLEIKKNSEYIEEEDKKTTPDDQLAEILKKKRLSNEKNHCKIQRTTDIPVARMRKKM
jgi:hypothetical protein